jgi:hypothetical protein
MTRRATIMNPKLYQYTISIFLNCANSSLRDSPLFTQLSRHHLQKLVSPKFNHHGKYIISVKEILILQLRSLFSTHNLRKLESPKLNHRCKIHHRSVTMANASSPYSRLPNLQLRRSFTTHKLQKLH